MLVADFRESGLLKSMIDWVGLIRREAETARSGRRRELGPLVTPKFRNLSMICPRYADGVEESFLYRLGNDGIVLAGLSFRTSAEAAAMRWSVCLLFRIATREMRTDRRIVGPGYSPKPAAP